jgi:hypothetical protein
MLFLLKMRIVMSTIAATSTEDTNSIGNCAMPIGAVLEDLVAVEEDEVTDGGGLGDWMVMTPSFARFKVYRSVCPGVVVPLSVWLPSRLSVVPVVVRVTIYEPCPVPNACKVYCPGIAEGSTIFCGSCPIPP